jgi:hypothetical protein
VYQSEPEPLLTAMIASFHTDEAPLAAMIRNLLEE